MKRLWLLAFLAVFVAITPCRAAETAATAKVKSVLEQAMDIQTKADLQGEANRVKRAQLIRKLIADNFSETDMAREVLKDHWEKLSAKQRSEFTGLFAGLFQDSYTRMVLNFLERESIEYGGESDGANGVWVRTTIMRANEHIPVRYLVSRGGKPSIQDVEIDGVSILDNYRTTFSRVIRTDSFEGLMKKMRTQKQAVGDGA